MSITLRTLKNLLYREDGVTAIEYALIGALIAVVIIGSVTNVGLNVLALYQNVADQVAAVVANAI